MLILINLHYEFYNLYLPQIAIVDGERDADDCLGGSYYVQSD